MNDIFTLLHNGDNQRFVELGTDLENFNFVIFLTLFQVIIRGLLSWGLIWRTCTCPGRTTRTCRPARPWPMPAMTPPFPQHQVLCLSIYLSTYLFYLSIYLSIYPSIHLSMYLCIYLSIYISIYLSIHLSIYLISICVSIIDIYRSGKPSPSISCVSF